MNMFKETEIIMLEGSYGDKQLRIEKAVPHKVNGINVVMLHGVFSTAVLSKTNKFSILASEMCRRGFTCWLVETTRNIHNRDDYADNQEEWVKLAFSGKTYAQEFADVKQAVCEVMHRTKGELLWLWGFSLGGISACLCAAEPNIKAERIIVSGSGAYAKKKAEYMFGLPIMNTLMSDISFDTIKYAETGSFISFRGQKDEIFSRRACEKLYHTVKTPRGRKMFYQFAGADHSIRCVNGVIENRLMKEMAQIVAEF